MPLPRTETRPDATIDDRAGEIIALALPHMKKFAADAAAKENFFKQHETKNAAVDRSVRAFINNATARIRGD